LTSALPSMGQTNSVKPENPIPLSPEQPSLVEEHLPNVCGGR
jgi:hypothetical protein